MGKRSNFERKPRDFYPTPYEAVLPLLSHLSKHTYHEPCAGNGTLIRHLSRNGFVCSGAWDIDPDNSNNSDTIPWIVTANAADIKNAAAQYITNPPWDRPVLHAIIENLRKQAPTWLLIDADWMHTKQAIPYLDYCSVIVSVGRVKWIPGSKYTGKDNCCWYCFLPVATPTVFVGRNANK